MEQWQLVALLIVYALMGILMIWHKWFRKAKPDTRQPNGWRVKVKKGVYDRYDTNFSCRKKNVSWRTWFRSWFSGWYGDIRAPEPYTRIDTYYVPDELVIDTEKNGIRFYRHQDDTTTIVTVRQEEIHLIERRYIDHPAYYLDPRVPRSDCAIVTTVTAESPAEAADWLPMFRQYRFGWLERFWIGKLLSKMYSRWTPTMQHLLENNPALRRRMNVRYIQPAAQLLSRAQSQVGLARLLTNLRVLLRYAAGVGELRIAYALQ